MGSMSTDDISIHQVTAETAHLLNRAAEDVFDHEIEPKRLAAFLAEPGHAMIVAMQDGVCVGQIRGNVHHQPDAPPNLYVDNLGVTPALQRRGIARRLMDALTAWGEAQGCQEVWVLTETDNETARHFYAALHFDDNMSAYLTRAIS